MKTIYFIRHAKAQKEANSDFERELSQRGKNDAKNAAKRLKEHFAIVDMIYCSTANRASKTARIIADEIKFKQNICFMDEFYNSNISFYMHFIKNLDNKLNTIFIIAHNPEITEISELLSDSIIGNIPTCGIFAVNFDVKNFCDIKQHSGKVLFFDYPKKHK